MYNDDNCEQFKATLGGYVLQHYTDLIIHIFKKQCTCVKCECMIITANKREVQTRNTYLNIIITQNNYGHHYS